MWPKAGWVLLLITKKAERVQVIKRADLRATYVLVPPKRDLGPG